MNPALSRIFRCACLLTAVAALPAVSAREIYTWTDENGVIHFVDTPPQVPGAVTMDAAEARRKLPDYESSRRVFYTDAAGETVRMDDEARVQLVEELKQFIEQNCL